MIFLIRAPDIAACESEARAQALERQGYERCSYAAYKRAWQAQDTRARLRIAAEDERAAEAREMARIVGKLPGVVYPVKVNEG